MGGFGGLRGGEALFLRLGVMTITPNTPQLYGVKFFCVCFFGS